MHIYVKPHNDYAAHLIEIAEKWQRRWAEAKVFEADPDPSKPKFFLTVAFPYPNGPAHMGHGRTYTITDAYARFKRMQGYNVLFPLGFHYTGTPILTMAEKVVAGDEKILRLLRKVYGVPEDMIPRLTDPLIMARYFHEISKVSFIEMGYSIDWRREFTTIDPEFKAFIRWQFSKLREKGFLVKGTHPVGWCPKHNMPVGMHDTEGDVEPEIGEWTLLFFTDDQGVVYPAATLRPETVFGVTNIWVNPKAEYVKACVDGRVWILSRRAAWKLGFQLRKVEVLEELRGEELLGRWVRNPVTGEKVPVLPADFVDPDTGTGVVMSVPAHAPYDYAAIRDLSDDVLRKLGVDRGALRPRPLIRVRGYGELPAVEIVEKMGIRSQGERDKLEEATKRVYGDEFKYGVMRGDIVDYVAVGAPPELRRYVQGFVKEWIAGRPVPEARENLVRWLRAAGLADRMYEIMNKP
ncbi:MAG: leucine--tRNA ligase, partial [Thermoprotei archaeon]